MSSGLTEEQRRRIEENKKKALEKRAAKQPQSVQSFKSVPPFGGSKSQAIKETVTRPQGYGGYNKSMTTDKCDNSQSITNRFYSTKSPPKSFGKQPQLNTQSKSSSGPGIAPLQKNNNTSHSSGSASISSTKPSTNIFSGAKFGSTVKGKCVLISRERFEVQVGYSAPLVDVFKSMSTKVYDAVTRKWSFKLEEYEHFMTAVKGLSPTVQIQTLPRAITQAFGPQIKGKYVDNEVPDADLSGVDESLVDSLLSFQRVGVNFGIHKNGRVLIADDMGLGKTIQAICLACYYREEWPLLIVVPSSVRFDWAQQIRRWVPSLDPQEITVAVTGKDNCSTSVCILSYDLMAKKAQELKQKHFQVVIMDESHLLKNYKTARCKAAIPILQPQWLTKDEMYLCYVAKTYLSKMGIFLYKSPALRDYLSYVALLFLFLDTLLKQNSHRVILLSGTPALSRPSELYTQISSISPFMFKFNDFGVRYCDGKQQPWGWDFSGSSNMGELQLLLEEKIMIRRLKKDVLSQLPSKVRQMVLLDPSSIKSTKDLQIASKVMNIKGLKGMERRGALLEYFHHTGKAKTKAVRDYVIDLMESEKKFLIFAHHKEVLDAIEDAVKTKTDNGYIRIDGRTTPEQRNFFCKKFQNSDDVKVAILSITAANAGLNLAAASLVIFGELFWNPGILVQAEDRAHRIGQQDMVSVHYLVAQGTADDHVWPLVQRKLEVLNKAGLSKDDFSLADTTTVKDSRQTDLMQYFEESFMEEDDPDIISEENDIGNTKEGCPSKKSAESQTRMDKNSPAKKEKTLFTYFETKSRQSIETESENQKVDDCAPEGKSLNSEYDLFLDDCEWDDEVVEPEAKKPRL